MEKYEALIIETVVFDAEDIIMASPPIPGDITTPEVTDEFFGYIK